MSACADGVVGVNKYKAKTAHVLNSNVKTGECFRDQTEKLMIHLNLHTSKCVSATYRSTL